MKSMVIWAFLLVLLLGGLVFVSNQIDGDLYGRGGCCGFGSNSPEETERLAADYYISKTGDSANEFSVKVEDFGCHQEAEIIKDGRIVMELSISGDNVSEI
jgi:hypothetical protein